MLVFIKVTPITFMIFTEHSIIVYCLSSAILVFIVTFIEVLDKHDEIILVKKHHEYSNKEFILGAICGAFFIFLLIAGQISEEYFKTIVLQKIEDYDYTKEPFTWENLIKDHIIPYLER